jgi:hypothetical protein
VFKWSPAQWASYWVFDSVINMAINSVFNNLLRWASYELDEWKKENYNRSYFYFYFLKLYSQFLTIITGYLKTSTKMLSNFVCEGGHNLHRNVAKLCAKCWLPPSPKWCPILYVIVVTTNVGRFSLFCLYIFF